MDNNINYIFLNNSSKYNMISQSLYKRKTNLFRESKSYKKIIDKFGHFHDTFSRRRKIHEHQSKFINIRSLSLRNIYYGATMKTISKQTPTLSLYNSRTKIWH